MEKAKLRTILELLEFWSALLLNFNSIFIAPDKNNILDF